MQRCIALLNAISEKNDAILNSEGQGIVRSDMYTKKIQITLLRDSNIRFWFDSGKIAGTLLEDSR